MIASSAPTSTVSSSATTIFCRTPEAGDGISVSTLSVETSSSGSSALTWSPSCFSQRVTVPSDTLSPSAGIVTLVPPPPPPAPPEPPEPSESAGAPACCCWASCCCPCCCCSCCPSPGCPCSCCCPCSSCCPWSSCSPWPCWGAGLSEAEPPSPPPLPSPMTASSA